MTADESLLFTKCSPCLETDAFFRHRKDAQGHSCHERAVVLAHMALERRCHPPQCCRKKPPDLRDSGFPSSSTGFFR